jgi:hypothetical protein
MSGVRGPCRKTARRVGPKPAAEPGDENGSQQYKGLAQATATDRCQMLADKELVRGLSSSHGMQTIIAG